MQIFEKRELEICGLFYLENVLAFMLQVAPVFIIVWFRELNFSLTQIGILTAAAALSILIFEIPTGAVADIYGRKFSVILGHSLEAILIVALLFAKTFPSALLVFILTGIAITFASGAKEAWVTDWIKARKPSLLHDYFMKSRSLLSVGLVISGLLGAFLVKNYGLWIVFPTSGIAFLVSIFILSFIPENYKKKKIHIKQSYKELAKQTKRSVKYSSTHQALFYILLALFFAAFAGAFGEGLSWIPFLQELNFPDHAFGYMWSAMWGVTIISPLLSKRLLPKNKEKFFIIKIFIIAGLFNFLVYFAKTWAIALGIMLLGEFFYEIKTPVENIYFHKYIIKKLRATIGSIKSMLISLAAIIAMPIAGYLVDTIGPRYVIMISSVLLIPVIICYWLVKEGE